MRISDWSSRRVLFRSLFGSLPCEGRGGLGRGAFGVSANRGHPLPTSPCLRRGRGQGKSSRLKPFPQGQVAPRLHSTDRHPHEVHECTLSCPPCWLPPPFHRRSRSEEHTSELQSLMRISYAVFCLKKKKNTEKTPT